MEDIRRVLVLTSDTGAGHRSVSNALIQEARRRPDYQIEFIDVDPFLPLPPLGDDPAAPVAPAAASPATIIDRTVRLYGPMIVNTPWLWGLTFHTTNNDLALRGYLAAFGKVLLQRVVRAAEQIDAQALVSVHPLVNHLMVLAKRRLGDPRLPLMTVITDLVDVHRWWATPEIDQYVVGSDVAAMALRRHGVPSERIGVLGIPIRYEYDHATLSAREAREQIGLDPDLPMVLLMSGGDGAGRVRETARAIGDIAHDLDREFQFVALTGRNERARVELAQHDWPVPTTVLGMVPNIATVMMASDIVVTKPGSLTVSESLALGRPMVLGRALPGQEEGNIGYIVGRGAGLHYRSPQEAAEAVAYLLGDPAARWEMGQAAMRLAKPRATERTLDTLQAMLLRAGTGARALAS